MEWVHRGYIVGTPWVHCGYGVGTSWVHPGYIVGTSWVHCGYIVGTVRKGAIISFTYCSFNTFKFKGSNMFDKPNRVVVGDGGGPNIESLF